MRPGLAILLLAAAAPAGAWSPDELVTEPNVPKEIGAQWDAPPAAAPGSDWEKFYFQPELGDVRTIWCRRKQCEAALDGGDTQRRLPLYYLAHLDAPRAAGAARASYWRAILSAYTMHWEPSRQGGLKEAISRPGTPLSITPSRPWKKEDSWDLEGPAVVLPPVEREVVPAGASLLVEAKDWPPCRSLEPASYGGSPSAIRGLHPMDLEIKEAATDSESQAGLYSLLKDMAAHPGAGAATSARTLRSQARSAAQTELDAKAPADRFDAFEAKFLMCRTRRYDHFQTFRTELTGTRDAAGFVAKWRQFVRGELAGYLKNAPREHDYQSEIDADARRTVAALDGRAPALALGPESLPHPAEMGQASDRVNAILEQVK